MIYKEFIKKCKAKDSLKDFNEHVDTILAIDRDYLYFDFREERLNVPELVIAIHAAREKPLDEQDESEIEAQCALYVLGKAWIRMEYVDMSLKMSFIENYLKTKTKQYLQALESVNSDISKFSEEKSWWELAAQLKTLRRTLDPFYYKIAMINGANWFRKELLLKKSDVNPNSLSEYAQDRLYKKFGLRFNPKTQTTKEYFKILTTKVIEKEENPYRLIYDYMKIVSEDPELISDHTTLLCPKGTNLKTPWDLSYKDFLSYVVFGNNFTPNEEFGVRKPTTICRAMYAHHSAKKAKMSKKYLAKYGAFSKASLEDNLGELGIYYNEDKHHKGHKVAGVVNAMRFLMPISFNYLGEPYTIEGLTDFRLTRASQDISTRYKLKDFIPFFPYALHMGTIIETVFSKGIALSETLLNYHEYE